MSERLLRVAIVVGALIDGGVGIFALFLPSLMGPLFDIPSVDPAFATFAGGEFLVAALVYVVIFRDLERYRPLLWLIAFDQSLAIVLPGYEIARGHIVASWKTIGPMPISALLVAAYVAGALAPKARGAA